jgi:hypothetical protein
MNMNETAEEIWKRHVKGVNIMTPDALDYIRTDDDLLIELAEGTDFSGNAIYGVSVRRYNEDDDSIEHTGNSDMFRRYDKAVEYIDELM